MMRILIIEDDAVIRTELGSLLAKHGYEASAPDSFADVVETALASSPHLVLLDLGLPMHDGHHICRELRKRSGVPIIVVTSRNTETDELMSMNLGADDFVAKPYNAQILLARIENVLRRAYGGPREGLLQGDGFAVSLDDGTVSANGLTRDLTKNELRILRLLMKNRGKIISRDRIMEELWHTDEFVDDNTLTVNINRLRRKLEDIGLSELIKTRRGQGYIL
ncbi:MAG: response regulator transcription factor [Clostridiales Family XIII bacterium]|jgi:DNA-binding response OmpR family regulator|nr:response regulator transcription factor [Clostridiales Family XIII bacterium]